jgi:hypothetical protein
MFAKTNKLSSISLLSGFTDGCLRGAAAMTAIGTLCPSAVGQSALPLRPCTSEVDFFGDLDGIVNLDAEVPHGALHLLMPKQKLDSPEVPSAAIDQGSLGPPQ